MLPFVKRARVRSILSVYESLVNVAGLRRLRTTLIMYKGNELTATIRATFQANRVEITNERSDG